MHSKTYRYTLWEVQLSPSSKKLSFEVDRDYCRTLQMVKIYKLLMECAASPKWYIYTTMSGPKTDRKMRKSVKRLLRARGPTLRLCFLEMTEKIYSWYQKNMAAWTNPADYNISIYVNMPTWKREIPQSPTIRQNPTNDSWERIN